MSEIWWWFLEVFAKLRGLYTVEITEEEPNRVISKKVYLIGEENSIWYALFNCPCGCNEKIYTKFIEGSKPRWSYELHDDKTISLFPSIWRNKGCKSHFFIERGRVDWCGEI